MKVLGTTVKILFGLPLIIPVLLFCIISMQACKQLIIKNSEMQKMKLIYVMDPQCGWCYGNSENISNLKESYENELEFELLVGGMWLGPNAPRGGSNLSLFLQNHAPAMERTTGAKVGQPYYDLAKDSTYVFSSLEASAAIVAVKEIASEKTFSFSKEVQRALMVNGKRLDKIETYNPILKDLSIDELAFKNLWMSNTNLEAARKEFERAASLVSGFPTLLLSTKDTVRVLASGYFNLEKMKQEINHIKNSGN